MLNGLEKKKKLNIFYLSTSIENGGVVVLDALDLTSATVTERLNGLFDQKYDDTEKTKFDVPENPQKPEIIIHQHLDWYALQI